jgi:cytoskeletal protein CcmA (bactofilin family)
MSLLSRRSAAPDQAATAGLSLLDSQLRVTGDLETSGSIRIDGQMDGMVRRADTVVIGVGATMTGDVHAREVIVGGTLSGNIVGNERVELQATGIVTGDITTQTVLVQEGGVINGRVLMCPPEQLPHRSSLNAKAGEHASVS